MLVPIGFILSLNEKNQIPGFERKVLDVKNKPDLEEKDYEYKDLRFNVFTLVNICPDSHKK